MSSNSQAAKQKLPAPLTEGQRLLQQATQHETLTAIIDKLGTRARGTVNEWLHGKKRPTREMRARIQFAYGIPVNTWNLAANTSNEPPPKRPPRDPTSTPSTLDDCLDMLDAIREQRNRADLINSERVKLADTEAKILALRARLELQAELQEDRIVRTHPEWLRLKRVMVKALEPFPEALRALVTALQEERTQQTNGHNLTNGSANGRSEAHP